MSLRRPLLLLTLPLALLGSGLAGLRGVSADASAAGRHLVAFGDSVPTGATCPCPNEVTLLGQRLSTRQGATIAVSNLARNGATSATVQGQVRSGAMGDPAGRVTTLTIGANDFDPSIVSSPGCANATCYRSQLHTTDGRIRTILDTLLADQNRRVDSTDPIVVTGYWNVFLDGAVGRRHGAAYVRNSDALTRALNTVLAHDAALYGVRYVDLYRAFKGDGSRDDTNLLGPDGDHPNAAGHRVIGATVNVAVPSAPAPSPSPTPTLTPSPTATMSATPSPSPTASASS